MWIETHQSLPNHPKLKRFARQLGISKQESLGFVIMLWLWALDYAPEGQLIPPYAEDDIADATEYSGDATVLVDALVSAGFLERQENTLIIHDWYSYAGRLLEKRKKDAERKRNGRKNE